MRRNIFSRIHVRKVVEIDKANRSKLSKIRIQQEQGIKVINSASFVIYMTLILTVILLTSTIGKNAPCLLPAKNATKSLKSPDFKIIF